MKIKITEIEANARELRESNTLADNFLKLLARSFQSHESLDEEEDNTLHEEEQE